MTMRRFNWPWRNALYDLGAVADLLIFEQEVRKFSEQIEACKIDQRLKWFIQGAVVDLALRCSVSEDFRWSVVYLGGDVEVRPEPKGPAGEDALARYAAL